MSNDMKLIMENWRRFEQQVHLDNDFKSLKETKMYVRNGKKQIIESKDKKQYKEVMSFGDYILALENKKLSFKEAEQIYFDTIDYEGSLLNEVSLAGVGQTIKGGIQKGVEKVKQIGQVAGQLGSAVVQGFINFIKKSIMGAIKLIASIFNGLVEFLKNPKTILKVFSKENKTRVLGILKNIIPSIVQYIKDNKWKLIATVAAIMLISVAGILILNVTAVAALPVASAMVSCGTAAVKTGTAAVKAGKAVMAAKAAGAGLAAGGAQAVAGGISNLKEAVPVGGVCKMVSNISIESLNQVAIDRETANALIGILTDGGKTLKATTETTINAREITAAVDGKSVTSSTENVDYKILSEKTEAVRVKAIEYLDELRRKVYDDPKLFKDLVSSNEDVNKVVLEAYNSLVNNGCKDPQQADLLANIGAQMKVFNVSKIESLHSSLEELHTTEAGTSFISDVSQYIHSISNTTVSMAAP